ncbi:MAG: ATP-binding protein [Bryobacteraceae bacterium]
MRNRPDAADGYRSLFEYNPAPMWLCDRQTLEFLAVNDAAQRKYGYSAAEFLRMRATDLVADEQAHALRQVLQSTESGTKVWAHRIQAGSWIEVELATAPIEFAGRTAVLAVIHDVTEQWRTQHELESLAVSLRESNDDLRQLTYFASHDLQEPLRMIASYTQLFAKRYRDALDDDAREIVQYVVEGVHRMNELIRALLTYSRVADADEQPLSETDVGNVIRWAMMNLEQAIRETQARVVFDRMPTIVADPLQLSQLFQNLISNAIKYRRSEPPEIHITADRTDSVWEFVVRDNGIGIDPVYFQRIFAPFKRLHGRNFPGTGIGLAICKKIVERHSGRIWVESTPGMGSAFHVCLPG